MIFSKHPFTNVTLFKTSTENIQPNMQGKISLSVHPGQIV